MSKDEVISTLENIARLLEIKGENPFKYRAYANAARALETFPGDLRATAEAGGLSAIEGIGKAISEKISLLVTEGHLEYYDALRAEFPQDILTLFEIQGLGGKKIKALYEALGVSSITSLERACGDGSLAALPGFGEKTAKNLLESIALRKRNAGHFLMSDATALASIILEDLRSHPAVDRVEVAGSFRRRKPVVRDLDFIVSSRAPEEVLAFFVGHPAFERTLADGGTKASVISREGIQCDLRVVTGREFPFALNYFTGSKEHNVRLRSRAQGMGWTLNEYRLAPLAEGGQEPGDIRDEQGLYRELGLDWIPPELREDRGEFDAAENGTLPRLVEWTNFRGTFHNHTTASDGRATLREMVDAARDLGLEYLGIADHSKSSVQANGLDEKRLLAQLSEIRELEALLDGFRIFAGIECDILKDGSLDFEDSILQLLDYVVVSVHSSFGMDEATMTRRIIRAMENPHATMLGHVTGRLLLTRDPYSVDVPAIIDAAAATGTIIELNANPRRLELDWTWWPLAKEKGVLCSINPDAHSTEGLTHLAFGADIARKGWLTRDDVINTRTASKVSQLLSAKRRAHLSESGGSR